MCGTNHLPSHLTLTIGETLSKHGNFCVNDHHVGSILGEDGAFLSEHWNREVLGTGFCWSFLESVISTPNYCQPLLNTPQLDRYPGIPRKKCLPHSPLSYRSCLGKVFESTPLRPPWAFNQLETKVANTAKHDRIVEIHNPQGPGWECLGKKSKFKK